MSVELSDRNSLEQGNAESGGLIHPPQINRRRMSGDAIAACIGLLLTLAYFLVQAWPGLFVEFQHDDVMNLHNGWVQPLPKLLWACVVPFTEITRPLVNAMYRVEFFLFGWDPLPYRIVTYVFFAANILLVYWLGKLLSGLQEIGLMAALLFSFHPRMDNLYMNNGTVYDAVGGLFYLLGLCVYIHARKTRGSVRGWPLAGVIAALVLGINSKEFLLSFPLILIGWELVYFRSKSVDPNGDWRGLVRRIALPLALCPLIALSIHIKRQPIADNVQYATEYSVRRVTQNLRQETSELLGYEGRALNLTKTALVHAAILAAAVAFRRRYLAFLFLYVLIAPFAVIFIPWRGLFAFYIGVAGWAIAGASILVLGRDWLLEHVWRRPIPDLHLWAYERIGLFVLIATLLLNYAPLTEHQLRGPYPGNTEIRGDVNDYRALKLAVPRGGSILMLNDRCETDNWTPYFVARLFYGDRDLRVDRVRMGQHDPNHRYDLVLDMIDGHLTPVSGNR